jgi:hypothetical protein
MQVSDTCKWWGKFRLECSNSRQLIYRFMSSGVWRRVLWYNVRMNEKNLLEPSTVTWTIFKDLMQCLRASTTLHGAQLNTAEIHVQIALYRIFLCKILRRILNQKEAENVKIRRLAKLKISQCVCVCVCVCARVRDPSCVDTSRNKR